MRIVKSPQYNSSTTEETQIPQVSQETTRVVAARLHANKQYHHAVLCRFYALYNVVEKGDPDEDGVNTVEKFLLCAESRYVRYLRLLENFVKSINLEGTELIKEFNRTMPLPPWYPRFS